MEKMKKKISAPTKRPESKRISLKSKNGSMKGLASSKSVSRQKGEAQAPVGTELVRRLGRFVNALESTDDLTARFTCRTIKLNLQPKDYGAEEVKKVREILGTSQAILAQFLGVSRGAVRDWEQGVKPPNGAACRLMDEIQNDPDYFRKRLRSLSEPVVSK
jgi:putative transcriptional regulator